MSRTGGLQHKSVAARGGATRYLRRTLRNGLCAQLQRRPVHAHELDTDARDPVFFHAERARRLGRKVDDAVAHIRTAIVDPHHH